MKNIIIIICLLLGICIAAFFLFAKDIDVSLSERDVQNAMTKKISEGPIRSRGIDLIIERATIDFKDSNMVVLEAEFIADGFGYSGKISGQFETGLRYNEPQIYLDNIVPISYQFTPDDESGDKIQDVKNIAQDFLKRQKSEILSDDAKTSFDNVLKRNEENLKEWVTTTTLKYFETLPLYNLNDAGLKGSLASFSLKDIRFTENTAVITLSPIKALIKILLFIGSIMLLFAYIYYIYLSPLIHPKKDAQT